MSNRFWDLGPMVVTGCTKVSEGCLRCWSETAHNRRCHNPAVEHLYRKELLTNGKFNGNIQFNLQQLEHAVKTRTPKVISPWNDLYHEKLTVEQIGQYHRIMANKRNAHHTFLIVTKRADRAADYCQGVSDISGGIQVPDNMWHLITCENQKRLEERMPHILRIPGKRGLLIEPMLGPVFMDGQISDIYYKCEGCGMEWGALMDEPPCNCPEIDFEYPDKKIVDIEEPTIHQVILGPENAVGKRECPSCKGSGLDVPFSTTNPNGIPCHRCEGEKIIAKQRPFDPAWAESVKAQCAAAGVPFYRKDTGEGTLAWRI